MSVRRKEQIYASFLYQSRTWGVLARLTGLREIKHSWNTDTHTFQIYIEHHLQYANANFSFQMRKCRNSITGQSSITLQSSSVWIMVTVTVRRCNPKAQPSIIGHCLPLKQHGLVGRVGGGWYGVVVRGDAGQPQYYCRGRWVRDGRESGRALFLVSERGSLLFHTGTVCSSAPDKARR